jgi:prepilin-type N-terminal cleavage/methylation domain-containing protein
VHDLGVPDPGLDREPDIGNPPRPSVRRGGFTLAEVLIAVAIAALLAAVMIPAVFGQINARRADAIIQEMQSLQQGILLYYRDVGRYPKRLDYLNSLTTGPLDVCGNALTARDSSNFRGPYINKTINMINPPSITKYLLATGDSVEASLARVLIATSAGGTQQAIQISTYGPDSSVANRIDQQVDGVAGSATGIIQYSAIVVPTEYVVKWTFAIKNGAC